MGQQPGTGAEALSADGPLDASTARRWVALAEQALRSSRAVIDALNVYPVPDGDTGTNLHLTIAQAGAEVEAVPAGAALGEVCRVMARAALLGARGNSGIIASQLVRGWADAMDGRDQATVQDVVAALEHADRTAWQAVEVPVEGTMLSVSRAASTAATAALGAGGASVGQVLTAAVRAARAALERTPEQLPVLAEAGVVDAGGAGVVLLLDALRAAADGGTVEPLGDLAPAATREGDTDGRPQRCDLTGHAGPAFEVMYLLAAEETAVTSLRAQLAALGDSLVVVGGGDLWHVHVHTDDPGAAVEVGLRAGRPSTIRITHFETAAATAADGPAAEGAGAGGLGAEGAGFDRRTGGRRVTDRRAGPPDGPPSSAVGVVAWAAGPGLAELFRASGVLPVEPAPGRRPSTGEVLDAVRASGARSVVVLPNDRDTLAVARAAAASAREEGIRVTVVPTKAQVQGLAAAAVHDATADLEQDVAAMSAAAGGTRHGAVTVAARDAITMAGPCRAGDVLGVVDGDFAVVGDDLGQVAREVVDRLLSGGGEMVTLVTGSGAPDDLAASVATAVRRGHHAVEVVVVDGGQPRYLLLVGVE